MRVYYSEVNNVVVVEKQGSFFNNKTLTAANVGGLVQITEEGADVIEVIREYSDFKKENNTSAGANITEVVDYLNDEFAKVSGANSFCRYELTSDQNLTLDLSGGVTDLVLDYEEFNTNTSIFSNSGGVVTVSQDGIYNISTCVILESPLLQAISKSQIGVFIGSNLRALDTNETTLAAGEEVTSLNCSTLVNLSEGDTITIKVSLYGVASTGRGLRLVNLFGTTANNLTHVSISKL